MLVLPAATNNRWLLWYRYVATGVISVPYRSTRVVSDSRGNKDRGKANSWPQAHEGYHWWNGFRSYARNFRVFFRQDMILNKGFQYGSNWDGNHFKGEREEASFLMILRFLVIFCSFRDARVGKTGCSIVLFT